MLLQLQSLSIKSQESLQTRNQWDEQKRSATYPAGGPGGLNFKRLLRNNHFFLSSQLLILAPATTVQQSKKKGRALLDFKYVFQLEALKANSTSSARPIAVSSTRQATHGLTLYSHSTHFSTVLLAQYPNWIPTEEERLAALNLLCTSD